MAYAPHRGRLPRIGARLSLTPQPGPAMHDRLLHVAGERWRRFLSEVRRDAIAPVTGSVLPGGARSRRPERRAGRPWLESVRWPRHG